MRQSGLPIWFTKYMYYFFVKKNFYAFYAIKTSKNTKKIKKTHQKLFNM